MHWISRVNFVLCVLFFFFLFLLRNLCARKYLHAYTSFRPFTDGEYKSERLNGKEDGLHLKQRAIKVLVYFWFSVCACMCAHK